MRQVSPWTVHRLAPLGLLAFWSGMAVSAHVYPGGYDWRYQTISVLLYADHNPHGWIWAWAGLELCGLCAIGWTASSGAGGKNLRVLQAGFACMCLAVLPDRLLPVPKGHEILAIAAFLAVCIGVMRQMFMTRPGFGAVQWSIPLIPLVLAGVTQSYLALARPEVPWISPRWRTLGIPLFLSFAVWEWVSCALFSVCLLLLWSRDDEVMGTHLRSRRPPVD